MYIGHYKSVSSPEEFFSSVRQNLDFPTQVEYNKKRYLLHTTHQAYTNSQVKRIINFAKENKIEYDVNV